MAVALILALTTGETWAVLGLAAGWLLGTIGLAVHYSTNESSFSWREGLKYIAICVVVWPLAWLAVVYGLFYAILLVVWYASYHLRLTHSYPGPIRNPFRVPDNLQCPACDRVLSYKGSTRSNTYICHSCDRCWNPHRRSLQECLPDVGNHAEH